nr:hypothetical protein B0A51_14061 [Rachicladosporium sp. CCFEE 5018]
MAPNAPILSIPLYYLLALYPHDHAMNISRKATPTLHAKNNPKSADLLALLQKRLSPEDWAAFQRSKACHGNLMENMPLFVSAVLAGVLAEREAERSLSVGLFAVLWLTIRSLYTAVYLKTDTQGWGYVRRGSYITGVALCFGMLGRAAMWL